MKINHIKENNPNWKGGMRYDGDGYKTIRIGTSYYPYHRFMVEQLLGRKLPDHAVVHHFNGKKQDNKFSNFIVCEDNSYHMLLHQRKRAYDACGHADWRKCKFCKEYDDPINLWISDKPKSAAYHRECSARYARERRAKCKN